MHHQLPVGLAPQDQHLVHRDDQQPSIREPPQTARRIVLELRLHSHLAGQINARHPSGHEIGEPQSVVTPPRTLDVAELVFEEQLHLF